MDFDGTACLHDVAEHMLQEFGAPDWADYDDAVDRGEIGLRDAITAQNAMLDADRDTLLAFAHEHCPMDPTFEPFVGWLGSLDVRVTLVSDGFGFYIEPFLAAAGLADIAVITNEQMWGDDGRPASMRFGNGHPECIGCGTCKMQAVLTHRERYGPVAFIGEGQTDRYGALYADMTFAKLDLVAHCERDGVPYIPWDSFDDVRAVLERGDEPPGPVAPIRCPGWTLPAVNGLPEGLTHRAMATTDADIDAVTQLIADSELADDGTIEIDREDIETDWARPAFDLTTESIGVFEGDLLVAEAEVFKGKRAEVNVHPDVRGCGIGTALLGWTEDLARALGAPKIAQTVSDSDRAAADLFARHGYGYGHTSWVLEIENTERPQSELPDGLMFRPYTDTDAHPTYQIIEDAFNEWPNRDPATFDDWAALTIGRPNFQPWQMLLVVDESTDEVVGVTFLLEYAAEDGWIQQVATKATHRHRGIARGMLQRSFQVFWDLGKHRVGVNTDSRTGALGVYEKVGMKVVRSYTNFAKDL